MVGAPTGALVVASLMVGAPTGALVVASLMVGAPAVGGLEPPAVRNGMVGAGAGALGAVGAPDGAGMVAVGIVGGEAGAEGGLRATVGVGGLTAGGAAGGGVVGSVAEGTAGGASAAFKVTRTVSFFKGTLEVCLEGFFFSLSLMRSGFIASGKIKTRAPAPVKPASLNF